MCPFEIVTSEVQGSIAFFSHFQESYKLKNLLSPLSEKIKGHEKNPIQFDPSLPHVSGFWYLSSIKYPEIIDDFGSFMEKNKTQIEKLKKKYNFYQ